MKVEKIRNLTDVELKHQERDLADQLFKLKFQMNMGQTESLKKIRGLRRDIARVISIRKKFYAHDEKREAHVGDVVRIEESRPLSRLKRWTLKEIVRKTALVPEVAADADVVAGR